MYRANYLLALSLIMALPGYADAKVLHSREGAMRLAFPNGSKVEKKHVFLTPKQIAAIEARCRCKQPSKLQTVYVGRRRGNVAGYSYIDTHRVRTLMETFMVVIGPDHKIEAVHILAFHEPPEYMPPARWLGQYKGMASQAYRPVAGVAGATLSARAINDAVRRITALHHQLSRDGALPR